LVFHWNNYAVPAKITDELKIVAAPPKPLGSFILKPSHVLALLLALFLTGAPRAQADELAAGATSAQIDQWIKDLDSDKFLVRENATQKLAEVSADVIERLETAVRSGSLEKSIRCIHLLRSFALGDDIAREKAAVEQIERIAEEGEDRVSSYAAEVLRKLRPLQQERSTRLLSGLGVKFSSYGPQGGFMQIGIRGPNIVLDDNYEGTAEQLYYLRQLDYIQDVLITGEKVNAEWLEQVAQMPSVELMTIKNCAVNSEMLEKLTPIFPRLISLRLYYIDVDGKGVESMSKLTSMRKGEFYGLDFTDQDKAKLAANLPPGVILDFRSGGFLGVVADQSGVETCEIARVQAGSGAEKGGLQSNDVVLKVDGVPVTVFKDLTDQLRTRRAGDKVKMEIQRAGETLEKTITLGQWPYREEYSLQD